MIKYCRGENLIFMRGDPIRQCGAKPKMNKRPPKQRRAVRMKRWSNAPARPTVPQTRDQTNERQNAPTRPTTRTAQEDPTTSRAPAHPAYRSRQRGTKPKRSDGINQVFRSGPRKGELFRRAVSAVVRRCFTNSGADRRFQCQNWAPKVPEATNMDPKTEPKRAKDPSKPPLRNRVDKVSQKGAKQRKPGWPFFENN